MKLNRHSLRPLATFAAGMLALIACQNTTEPSNSESGPITTIASYTMASSSRLPDSISWKAPKDSGSRKQRCNTNTLVCSDTFHLSKPLGQDSIALQLWTLGIRTYTFYFGEKENPTTLGLKSSFHCDLLDTLLLSKYNALTTTQKASFSALGQGASSLVAFYASLLLAGDTSFVGKPLPVGMSRTTVDKHLVYLAAKQEWSVSQLLAKGLLPGLDSATVLQNLKLMIKAKVLTSDDSTAIFPPYPVRVKTPIAVNGTLTAGGSAVSVSGAFAWTKGRNIKAPVIQVRTSKPGDSVNILFPTNKFASTDTIWSLDGNLNIQASSSASAGIDTLVITIFDDAGDRATSRTEFQVVSSATIPTFSPNGGTFYGSQNVTVTAASADSIQTSTDSVTWTKYTSAVPVTSTTKLHARAFKGGVASAVVSAAFTSSTVPVPTITPNGGTFYAPQTISVTGPTGTDSVQTSTDSATWNKYAQAISITKTGKLHARSFAGGVASPIVSASFTIATVPVPSISPNGGTFYAAQTATVAAPETDSVQTSTDSATWTKYTTGVSVSASAKLHARSFKGGVASSVVSASFIIGTVPVPTITPNGGSFYGTTTVTVAAAGSDSIQTSKDSTTWTKYSGALVISSTEKIYARAFKGSVASTVTIATFTSSAVPVPTIAPNGGTFYSKPSVSITAPAGTDSIQTSRDSIAWTKYTQEVSISSSGKLHARSFAGGVASPVVSATFTIATVPVPSISPNGGTFYSAQNATVLAAGTDSIQTSTDSVLWTKYTTGVSVTASGKLHARAFKDGVASAVVSAPFVIGTVPLPVFSPDGGVVSTTQDITVTAAGSDSIQTSLDGTTNWTRYSAALHVSASRSLYARAFKGGVASATVSADFTVPPLPVITPNGGAFTNVKSVTITATAGTIEDSLSTGTEWNTYFTEFPVSSNTKVFARTRLSGVTSAIVQADFAFPPTLTDTVSKDTAVAAAKVTVTAPGSDSIMVSTNKTSWTSMRSGGSYSMAAGTLYAFSKTGSASSSVDSIVVKLYQRAPSISPEGGVFASAQNVALTSSLSGAEIFYTTNGTTPASSATGSTSKYNGPFAVGATKTIKAIAVKAGFVTSVVASAVFDIADSTTYGIPWNSSITFGAIKDSRDGQIYRTVRIGTQTWMAQNMNHAVDSSWCYGNSTDSCGKYGRLYHWSAAMDEPAKYDTTWLGAIPPHKGVCPTGWHLSSEAEWSTLQNYVDSATAGTKLKSTSGWYENTGTDAYGFRMLPGGIRTFGVLSFNSGTVSAFWTASQVDDTHASDYGMSYSIDYMTRGDGLKTDGYSVRCVED